MSSAYTVEQYLLDRALIDDTITRLHRIFDIQLPVEETVTKASKDVFSAKVFVDYTSLLGGEPYSITGEDQARHWLSILVKLDSFVHQVGRALTDLPVPDGEAQRPTKVEASLTCMTALNKGDKFGFNGGLLKVDLAREDVKGNPWRITGLSLSKPVYKTGDDVLH